MINNSVKTTFLLLLVSIVLMGASSLSSGADESYLPPTYQRDIQPLLAAHCLSCHGPRERAKRQLDTYEIVSDKIDDIIYRVQLPSNNRNFMPYKMRQPPLSSAQISLLKAWKAGGLLEK